jgi:magnesium transporter
MIHGYAAKDGRLTLLEAPFEAGAAVVWFDLLTPSLDEERAVEAVVGLDVPTREEMDEIEVSSRLYVADGALFMTALLPSLSQESLEMAPVSFILAGERLITVRYHEPSAFRNFALRNAEAVRDCTDGEAVLIQLLDAIIERLADILEASGRALDRISRGVFANVTDKPGRGRDYRRVLQDIGQEGDLISNISDSLLTLERMTAFLGQNLHQRGSKNARVGVKSLARDVRSLETHAGLLSQKVTFLLDATLGLITIEQNGIIKILSVAAAVFLPPTLIASIYGMNFTNMPELGWRFGYPLALVLMILTAALPFWFLKRKGWL